MISTGHSDRLTFAKRWAAIANNQFNEATGPQVDASVFNLSAAEVYRDASFSLVREAYPRQQMRQHLRAMSRIRHSADAWLTTALVSFALTCSAALYFVYLAFRHI